MMKTTHIFLAASCLALNLALAKIAALLSLPIYLDSIGTVIAAVLLPSGFTIAVGVLTSLIGGLLVSPYFPAYAGTQIAIALIAIAAARLGLFLRVWKAVLAGFAIAIVASLVSAPVTALLFGGVTLSGTTAVNALLLASGKGIWKSVIGGSLIIESLDKPVACILAFLALRRLPSNLKKQAHSGQ
jgi:energy-coupling factor transport system substrate-specific component